MGGGGGEREREGGGGRREREMGEGEGYKERGGGDNESVCVRERGDRKVIRDS